MLLGPDIQKFIQQKDIQSFSVYKSGSGSQVFLAQNLIQQGQNVVLILPDQQRLEKCVSLLQIFANGYLDKPFWEREWIVFPSFSPFQNDFEQWAQRWANLFTLLYGPRPCGVMLTIDNLLPFWPAKEVLEKEYLYLMQGEEFEPEEIMEKAVQWGYERVSMVTRPGEFSLRGDILDIYASGYEYPVRMEFFGDMLESVRLFEPLTQRSKKELSELVLLPISPVILHEDYINKAKQHWEHLWKIGALSKSGKVSLMQKVEEGENFLWPGIFYQNSTSLSELLPSKAVFILAEASHERARLDECSSLWHKYLKEQEEKNGWSWPVENITQSINRARQAWLNKRQILFEDLPLGERSNGLALPEKRYNSYQELFWRPQDQKRPWSTLIESLQEWKRTNNQVVLTFGSENARHRFFKLLEGVDLDIFTNYKSNQKGIFALISDLSVGLKLEWNHLAIFSENVLQPQKETLKKKKGVRKDFKGLKRYDDIKDGDLIVHRDYGLGRFAGLTRLQVDGTGNDYLLLYYAEGDKLYVPVDRLNLIQRYKGPEGTVPSLDKLGSNRWSNTKDRVRKALETIAHDLISMYAYRKVAKGYTYPANDDLLREFEATFDFEETPDQEQAISEVLRDMEKSEPMDRLVCGDVGFGKTEVAMRAAFKAVVAGKQVALLCPTTILAEQHFQNFVRRMENFSVNIEMISRFIPPSRQKEILRKAEKGEVDILIGTHRLLSQDVYLPRLSLFILDEEQRFGVRHKEKLKKLRQNIDVLTLTATPIPRTLQLSLSGLRQLSIIETPPQERKAVETSLVERDPEELASILNRELERKGQVFWVYNRVNGLERVKRFVQSLVPQARVAIAHGQMSERNLEDTMHRFWYGEIDVLVTTAIIESGLDFPKTNTLVVDRAHQFGLSQLYQLRGRVGRSKEQAYAYFVVPSLNGLSKLASKRLQTILDMDYLGAGFQVAMEDLRIRGAGNILGEVQSGNISKVGLDLFLQMLEQEVRRVKGEPLQQETEPELNITFEANIPTDYIADPQERLHYYKGISSARNKQRLTEWADEMKDRFGPLPEQVKNLLAVIELKRTLVLLQVERADLFTNRILLTWLEDSKPVDPEKFVLWMQKFQDRVKFFPPAKLELRFESKISIAEAIHIANSNLNELFKQIEYRGDYEKENV